MGLSRDIKRLSLTLTWISDPLVTKILKSSIDTLWSQKGTWSFTAVDFLDFDLFPIKIETTECSATLEVCVDDLKITLILQKGRFLLILFLKRVLKSSDNLPRNCKTITKSFFSAVNVTGFSVSLLLRKFLMKLSISFIGNEFFFNISFKWHTFEWNLGKSETTENVQNNKVNIKATLYSLEMKLLKFEYAPLNVGLWYTDVLKPSIVLVINKSKKAWNYYVLSHRWI